MCETLTYNEVVSKRTVRTNRGDPSRTAMLRIAFIRDMLRRFNALVRLIRIAVVEEDVFGLLEPVSNLTIHQHTPGPRRFAFPRNSQKVAAFMDWLNRQVRDGVLDVTNFNQVGEGVEYAWTNKYINDSYRRGVTRARYQMRQAGFDVPPLSASGGIDAVMNAPFHIDRVGLLFTRAFNELRGITNAMDQTMSRTLAQGLADGLHPRTLAKELIHVVTGQGGSLGLRDTLGRYIPPRRRAEMLARTETIRAHAEAQLQEFKSWGVVGVSAKAEFRTAQDTRVCPDCEAYEGNIFTIEQAQGLIPVHPSCRCIWLPISNK